MKDQDPKNMSVINDLKEGHSPVSLSHLEGGAYRRGEEPVQQALTSADKSKVNDVIIIGGHDELGLRGYKLTDLDGDSNVIPKIHDDRKRGSVLRHVSRKKEIRVEPKPITLRNLFDVPPRFEA